MEIIVYQERIGKKSKPEISASTTVSSDHGWTTPIAPGPVDDKNLTHSPSRLTHLFLNYSPYEYLSQSIDYIAGSGQIQIPDLCPIKTHLGLQKPEYCQQCITWIEMISLPPGKKCGFLSSPLKMKDGTDSSPDQGRKGPFAGRDLSHIGGNPEAILKHRIFSEWLFPSCFHCPVCGFVSEMAGRQ